MIMTFTTWTQDINWTYIRHSENVLDVFCTSYILSSYVLCPGVTGSWHRKTVFWVNLCFSLHFIDINYYRCMKLIFSAFQRFSLKEKVNFKREFWQFLLVSFGECFRGCFSLVTWILLCFQVSCTLWVFNSHSLLDKLFKVARFSDNFRENGSYSLKFT